MPASSLAQISPLFSIEDRQAALDVRAVEHAGVGDENHFDFGFGIADCGLRGRVFNPQSEIHNPQFCLPLHFGARFDDLVEVFVRRWFAVAGEGDVVEAAEVGAGLRGIWAMS